MDYWKRVESKWPDNMAKFSLFLHVRYMDQEGGQVHKLGKKKERGRRQYQAILTEQAWSIKDLLYDVRAR